MEQRPLFNSKNTSVPSISLLEKTRTNVIIREKLAQLTVTLLLTYNVLKEEGDNDAWKWLADFADDCITAGHNIDGTPRLQFIEGLKADAIIQQEVEKRRLMSMNNST